MTPISKNKKESVRKDEKDIEQSRQSNPPTAVGDTSSGDDDSDNRDQDESPHKIKAGMETGLFREVLELRPDYKKVQNEASSHTSEEDDDDKNSLISVVRNWTDGTSVHGVRYAFDPDFFPWKHIAWSAIVTAMAVIMVLATFAVVNQYLQYNTKSSRYTKSPPQLPFPEVTVCNANPFQRSLMERYNISWPKDDAEVLLVSQDLSDFILETQFNNFSYFTQSVDKRRKVDSGLTSNWRSVITPGGRCWSFVTNQTVSVPGQNGGLSFVVDLQQFEYTRDAVTAGISFYVAQPGTQIVEQMTLNAASPGGAVAATFSSQETLLEKRKPWSYCTGQAPEYTQNRCREECSNRARGLACNCRPMGDTQPELMHLTYCGPSDELCMQSQSMYNYENCNCSMPPCREFHFPVKSTSAQLSRRFQRSVESYLNVTENYMADNIVIVTLNYESMIQHVFEETRAQSPYELMAAIGGVTGLYMGVSLISIVEVFGELLGLRMIPRLWGDTRLYGIGGRS